MRVSSWHFLPNLDPSTLLLHRVFEKDSVHHVLPGILWVRCLSSPTFWVLRTKAQARKWGQHSEKPDHNVLVTAQHLQ